MTLPRKNAPARLSHLVSFFLEHLDLLLIFSFILTVFSIFLFYLTTPKNTFATVPYSDLLFRTDTVHKIEINMSEESRALQLSAPDAKNKYLSEIKIDGEPFFNVTVSTRGNASLSEASDREDLNKYSYKLNFSRLDPNQTYHGLNKLVLGNFFNDPSYLRDYIAYSIMQEAGVPTPLVSFTELLINGEPQGLYLAIEEPSYSFLARNNLAQDSALFKPESALNDIFLRRRFEESNRATELTTFTEDGRSVPAYFGADLVYRGDSPEAYSDIFHSAIIKYSPKDEEYIIRCIKSLTEPAPISSCWDYNSLAKYFAAHNFIINRDSYIGSIAHNYYLLLSDHHLTFLPWDYNYAFLGFTIDGEVLTEIPEETSIFNPNLGVPDSERPLWARLKSDPDFLDLYLNAYESLLTSYIDNGRLSEQIASAARLIRRHVAADPNRTFDLADFDSSVEYLENFIHARSLSVQRQIWDYKKLPSEGEMGEEVVEETDLTQTDGVVDIKA